MASVDQCRTALDLLASRIAEIDPRLRAAHLPHRDVSCQVRDLDARFVGTLDADGLGGLRLATAGDAKHREAQVRIGVDSDELVALANGDADLISAWLRGKVSIGAPWRDLVKLRSLGG